MKTTENDRRMKIKNKFMKLKKIETENYRCDNCRNLKKHIDMYDEEFCYECIDVETGKIKAQRDNEGKE